MRARRSKITLPKHINKDAVKWVLTPAKIMLDGLLLWPENQNGLNLSLTFFIFLNYVLGIVGEIIYACKNGNNFTKILSTLTALMVPLETIFRQILLVFKKEEISEVLTEIYFEFWSSNICGTQLRKKLAAKSLFVFVFFSFYTSAGLFAATQYFMLPLIIGNRELPLLTDYPFDWKKSPIYELLYTLQAILCGFLLFGICAFDMLFVSLVWNCTAQFQILGYYFQSEFGKTKRGVSKSNQRRVLIKFIKQHQKLLKTCKKLENIYQLFLLSLLLGNIVTVCVPSSLGGVVPHETAKMVTFCLGHLCQLLLYGFLGSQLIYESTALSDSIIHSNWYLIEDCTDLKKSLVMIIMRCQKEVHLTAGGFMILNLTTCIKVLRLAFSLYTLLNTVLENEK